MSGPETACPICHEAVSGDWKCHNPDCRASDEYYAGGFRGRVPKLQEKDKMDPSADGKRAEMDGLQPKAETIPASPVRKKRIE